MLSSLQSCCEYFAANSTWSYTKLTRISFPSGPTGPTSAMWFGSALVYRVFTIAQASLAPCRQADIFHNRKRRRAPLSFFISSPMPPGGEADGHKAWVIPCITCRTCSCNYESSGRRSPAEPGISSVGRPISIPADITLLAGFFTEVLTKFVQALSETAASKPLILLHRVRKLGSNIFQFHALLDIGVLEIVFLLPNFGEHTLASL